MLSVFTFAGDTRENWINKRKMKTHLNTLLLINRWGRESCVKGSFVIYELLNEVIYEGFIIANLPYFIAFLVQSLLRNMIQST